VHFFLLLNNVWGSTIIWLQTFYKIYFMFHITKEFIQVWNNLRASKWWQNWVVQVCQTYNYRIILTSVTYNVRSLTKKSHNVGSFQNFVALQSEVILFIDLAVDLRSWLWGERNGTAETLRFRYDTWIFRKSLFVGQLAVSVKRIFPYIGFWIIITKKNKTKQALCFQQKFTNN